MGKPAEIMFTCCIYIALVALAGTFSSQSMAGPVYKSIDAQGNVTYSSEPVQDAAKVKDVEIHPGPSKAAQEAAHERVRQMESSASEIREANTKRTQKREIKKESAEVEAADSYNRVNDGYRDPYRRARTREAIKNSPGRPSQPIARPPAGRPGGPGGGGRGR